MTNWRPTHAELHQNRRSESKKGSAGSSGRRAQRGVSEAGELPAVWAVRLALATTGHDTIDHRLDLIRGVYWDQLDACMRFSKHPK